MDIIPVVLKEDSDKQRQESVIKQQREYKRIGRVLKIPGHTLFSYNKVTGEIKIADVTKEVKLEDGVAVYAARTVVEKDRYYEQALNQKNFIKRLKRNGIYNY